MSLVVYGAYGYTGQLIVERALAEGLAPLLAGRNAERLAKIAERAGLPHQAVSLDDAEGLRALLQPASAVIHCAGPFEDTSEPMADACLASRCHYLDITGEVSVFEALRQRDAEAKSAGVTLLPGAGFDVVPSDCLAAHVASRLPGATRLEIALTSVGPSGISRGTARTILRQLGRGSLIRVGGVLTRVPILHRVEPVDFGGLVATCTTASWGDLSTAHHSTGIPDIEILMGVDRATLRTLRGTRRLGPLLRLPGTRWIGERAIRKRPAGPTEQAREAGAAFLRAQVWKGDETLASVMSTPEGYTLTAITAVELARRAEAGELPAGFQTPSTACGADFALSLDGCSWTDVETS